MICKNSRWFSLQYTEQVWTYKQMAMARMHLRFKRSGNSYMDQHNRFIIFEHNLMEEKVISMAAAPRKTIDICPEYERKNL